MERKVSKRDLQWQEKYEQMKVYITEHRHLPSKKRQVNRGLRNWWKYNCRLVKQGKISAERLALLRALSEMRDLQENEGMLFRMSTAQTGNQDK